MLPLDGVLVVGLEQAVSAPYCTRQLADLGARVIKLETRSGDFARAYDNAVGEVSAHFAWANRGKESVVLDLKSPEDRELAERMLARADVLVQNLAPGAAQRLGFDARSAVARHPQLVAVDISGYGTGGARADSHAYDLLVQSEAGSCAVTGTVGQPAKPGIPLADASTGMVAANAIMAALIAKTRTGTGAAISVAMFDVVTDLMSWALHQARATGENPVPLGLSSPMVAPYGAFITSDAQTIVIGTTNDSEWQRLAVDVLDRPELAGDDRYAHNSDRVARRAEIDAVIAQWASRVTFSDASAAAEAAAIGWARYNTPLEVLDHPELADRDRWVRTAAPGVEFLSLRPAADSPAWEWRPRAVPGVGEHTRDIRAGFALDSSEP